MLTNKLNNILIILSLLISLSCAKTEESSISLRIGLETEPERLNPITLRNPQTFRVAWQIYEGLLDLDENGTIIPRIAENWETEDHRIWTFHIRKEINFHKSELFDTPSKTRPVTAQDVMFSYTRFCGPDAYPSFVLADSIKGCSDYNKGEANKVEGLRILGDHTFQIELNKPEPFFLSRITSPWICIFPKESEKEEFKDRWGLNMAVGTGPYRLVSKTDNEIILEINNEYWDKSRIANIKKIIFRVIKNEQLMFTELLSSKIDLMVLPNQLFSAVFDDKGNPLHKYKESFEFKETNTFNTHLIGINMKNVSDVHLRRAMFYGTNRSDMAEKILLGYADPIGDAVPPGMNGYVSAIKNLYDPVEVKMELDKSKYNGEPIELLMHDAENSELISQLFQKQMKDIGINIKLTKLDYNSIIGRMVKGQTEMFSIYAEVVFSSPEPLLLNLFSSKKIPVPNFWHYSNPSVDRKFEELRDISNRKESVKISAEIAKEIMKDVPAIFLYRNKQVIIFNNDFKNLRINGHSRYMLEEIEAVL